MNAEKHPLSPFLPLGARVLMLGSFPPQRVRWSMDFFYPNFQNDMWRILGYIFAGDKNHFICPGEKRFDRERIEAFCREQGIALYDTAEEVVRLKNNASDNFLQIVRPVNLAALLEAIPICSSIVVTGQKAAETLSGIIGVETPQVGKSIEADFAGRRYTIWRMPSSSRAYPRPIEWKAEFYRKVFGL